MQLHSKLSKWGFLSVLYKYKSKYSRILRLLADCVAQYTGNKSSFPHPQCFMEKTDDGFNV